MDGKIKNPQEDVISWVRARDLGGTGVRHAHINPTALLCRAEVQDSSRAELAYKHAIFPPPPPTDRVCPTPSPTLCPQVIRDNLSKGEIDRDQLAAHAFLLVVAGNATVASMINLVGTRFCLCLGPSLCDNKRC